jgi:hypothetical protein
MRKVDRSEIVDYVTYNETRDAFRAQVLEAKAPRRLHVAPHLSKPRNHLLRLFCIRLYPKLRCPTFICLSTLLFYSRLLLTISNLSTGGNTLHALRAFARYPPRRS